MDPSPLLCSVLVCERDGGAHFSMFPQGLLLLVTGSRPWAGQDSTEGTERKETRSRREETIPLEERGKTLTASAFPQPRTSAEQEMPSLGM